MAIPGYGVFTNNNYLPDLMQQTTPQAMPQQLQVPQHCGSQLRTVGEPSLNVPAGVPSGMVPVNFNTQLPQRVPLVQPPDLLSTSCLQPDVVPVAHQDLSSEIPVSIKQPDFSNSQLFQQEAVNQSYHVRPDACSPYSFPHQTENLSPVTSHMCPTANVSYPAGFTFTVPTQASTLSAGPAITNPSRWIYTNTTPHCHAPGMGALWQHAVPTSMPWGDNSVRQQQGLTTFTASYDQSFQALGMHNSEVQRNTESINVGHQDTSVHTSDSVSRPKPSCSVLPRRPKRHYLQDESASCTNNKIFLSEEKMMERMRELSLCQSSSGAESDSSMPLPIGSRHPTINKCGSGWRTLKEIEERLEIEDSDDDGESNGEGPKLKLMADFSKELLETSSVLPKKIIEDIRSQQCTEIVLWKPPGDFVQNVVPKSAKKTSRKDHMVMSDSKGRDHMSLQPQLSPQDLFVFTASSGICSSTTDSTDMEFDDSMQL